MKWRFIFLLLFPVSGYAQTSPTPEASSATVTSTPSVILEKPITFSGDLRYRLQSEKQEPKEQRKMQRLQARLQAAADVQENLKVYLRLMTGTAANSGNQTLGDEKAPGQVRRSFGLDLAYFDFQPYSIWTLQGGRTPQPFIFVGKNQMILDRDIVLEGVATKLKIPVDEDFQILLNGGASVIRENYDSNLNEDMTDNMLYAAQLAVQYQNNDWTATAGYGSFAMTGLKNTLPANLTIGAGSNGNTLDSGKYPANFDLDELFIEAKKKISDFEISLFYETVKNKDVDDLNKANAYGATLTFKKWTFSWTQQLVQKDAVVGLFTDSDFAGGQTSSRGQIYGLNYKFSKKVNVQYTVFENENSIETAAAKYQRSHLDLNLLF